MAQTEEANVAPARMPSKRHYGRNPVGIGMNVGWRGPMVAMCRRNHGLWDGILFGSGASLLDESDIKLYLWPYENHG